MSVSEIALPCVVKDNGAIEVDRAELLRRLRALKPGPGMLRIQRKRPPHSDPQRGYYFGVIVKRFAARTGYTIDEMHEVLKAYNLDKQDAAEGRNGRLVDGLVIGGSIADDKLDTGQMHAYIERCREWGIVQLEEPVPDPDPDYKQALEESRALHATSAPPRRFRGDWDDTGVPA